MTGITNEDKTKIVGPDGKWKKHTPPPKPENVNVATDKGEAGSSPVLKEKKEEKVVETRGKDSITKSKGGKSSTYNITNKVKNKDGSITYTFTNEHGNSFKEIHSSATADHSKIKRN